MPRPRSQRITEIKAELIRRLQHGFDRAGDRLLSTRALARRYRISFPTAHTLLAELTAEGLLERRSASGTFIPGNQSVPAQITLVFHQRARRPGSFGARLLSLLENDLADRELEVRTVFSSGRTLPAKLGDSYPVIWECPAIAHALARGRDYSLALNDRPQPGLAATYIASVSPDDLSAGATAAEVLMQSVAAERPSRLAMVAGPADDVRCQNRVAGFRQILPDGLVTYADGWFHEDGVRCAGGVLRAEPAGIFCSNDRLAQGVLDHARDHRIAPPPLIGFDDAPIAQSLRLTTMAIPFEYLIGGAVEIIERRMGGDNSPAQQRLYTLRPVIRETCTPRA